VEGKSGDYRLLAQNLLEQDGKRTAFSACHERETNFCGYKINMATV
jgi:hypothetical protein